MSLEDDLKARALALISQQMANWVVEIQNHIRQHQANLVATLDELQESVARYDEKINESDVAVAMSDVVASQPPAAAPEPPPAGPGPDRIRKSLAELDKGTSLSEVLTALVNEVAGYVERAAIFIVKGTSAIGWYARGVEQPDVVRSLNIPLSADTVFRIVQNSRHALRGHVSHSPGTAQALARLGGSPQGVLAVPLILRDKLAAILYCDTQQEEVPQAEATAVEILMLFAGKTIDLLSLAPKAGVPAPAPAAAQVAQPAAAPAAGAAPGTMRPTTSGIGADRAAGLRAAVEEARGAPRTPGPASIPPTPVVPAAGAEASSTVVFNAQQFQALRQQQAASPAAPPRPSAAPPPPVPLRPAAPPASALRPAAPPAPAGASPEEQKAHEDAKRFARLVVSEIKLYNETKVNEGRRHRDLYERLKEDIERGRQMYTERVPAHIRDSTNYFVDELVRILAGGDSSALGPM
jgi:hypothetical protein